MSDAAYKTEQPQRRKAERPAETEWVTDEELIALSGVPARIMWTNIKIWERSPAFGFPPKVPLYGDRRHWPSVKAFFQRDAEAKMRALSGSKSNARS
jgi:hypothetical protein